MQHFVDRRLCIVLGCSNALANRVRYVFDTLLMPAGIPAKYCSEPPHNGPWVLYGQPREASWPLHRCCAIAHSPAAWRALQGTRNVERTTDVEGLRTVFGEQAAHTGVRWNITFDLPANAFFFLSSWSERITGNPQETRRLFTNSVYAKLAIPQNIVDLYLERLLAELRRLCGRLGVPEWRRPTWPDAKRYAVVLSHDVDFLPQRPLDIAKQGGKTLLRHLVRERAPIEALRAMGGLVKAVALGRDPYGCVPELIERERALQVRASFQVAVARRHPLDVNYELENERTRTYLQAIRRADFDLCLHGSYRSTENPAWYVDEVDTLRKQFGRPKGSRQHFLSFDYDVLFRAQETAGIEYDMSIGFPDRTGPRAGFSYPYFPYCLDEDRPYNVVQIGLLIMDVTLRSYMKLNTKRAWESISDQLKALAEIGGCGSVVWHPIVFGGARDPGFGDLFWRMVEQVKRTDGLATDGARINENWRSRARDYESFASRALASPVT
jgi:hypothetical protein